MLEKILLAATLVITPASNLVAQNNNEAVVEHTRSFHDSHDYILKYLNLQAGEVNVTKKSFTTTDFPDHQQELERILQTYEPEQMETMSFTFAVRKAGKIATKIGPFWDSAKFKAILINENGTKRPVFSTAKLNDKTNNYLEEWTTEYDRENFTITQTIKKTNEEQTISTNTYEEETFRQVIDPLSIIHELMNNQPRAVNNGRLNIGYFYSPGNGNTSHENLFQVELILTDETSEWNGEIILPAGVFLKENSVRTRIQYHREGDLLIPSYNNKLYLKPGDGVYSYLPDWAYTRPR